MKLASWIRAGRDWLVERFPFATNFLSLLILDRWLVPAVIGVVLTAALGVGLFLKLWLNTPAGFEPAVKISAFDWLQAEALTRSAEKHEAAGRDAAAQGAWRGVVENAPGRPEAVRRYLRHLRHNEVNRGMVRNGMRYGYWLLRLTDEDPSDVELVAQCLEKGRQFAEVINLVGSQESPTAGGRAAALRARFWLGQIDSFETRLASADAAVRKEPLMDLYASAAAALSEISQSEVDSRSGPRYREFARRSKVQDPYAPEFLPARRLSIRVLAAAGDLVGTKTVLEDLRKRRQASFADHLFYWGLLSTEGRTSEVVRQLTEAGEPASETEAFSVVKLLFDQGRIEDALRVSTRFVEFFNNPLNLWLDHGNLLVESKRWGELRSLAMNVNRSDRLTHLWAIAKYWGGLAELFLGESETAASHFLEIADYPMVSVTTSFDIVRRLRELGHPLAARRVLHQMEETAGEDPDYWVLRCRFAAADKDLEELVDSAAKAFERDSDSLANVNNQAVALLLAGKDPETALELGRRLVAADGSAVIYRLTLIHGLIQNELLEEAEAELAGLEGVSVPTAGQFADYRLAVLELAYAQRRFDDVVAVGEALDTQFFMPEKVAWIEAAVAESRRHG